MPEIIRTRDAVRGASMEDLNYTYRALRDDPAFTGFTSRAAAEVQVQMAIMAAEDAVGHAGVPKGVRPHALTAAELEEDNPYRPGTMSHALRTAINQQTPIEPRVVTPEKPKRFVIRRVTATFNGESKPHTDSVRAQVLAFVQNAPNSTATIEEVEAHFQQPVRGYLQKLVEKKHLVVVNDEGDAS